MDHVVFTEKTRVFVKKMPFRSFLDHSFL